MTPPAYTVERTRPDDVADDLCALWDRNLTVEGGVRAKFAWLYRDAPRRASDVFLLVAGDGARVGTAGVGVRGIQLGDRDGAAGLLADLAVDKNHRSVGPALALTRAVKEWALGQYDIAYGFPNKLAAGVFKRVGYRTLGTITRWARVLRHRGYVDRVRQLDLQRVPPAVRELLYRGVEWPGFASVASRAIDVAQLARRSPATVAAARQLRLSPAGNPARAIDDLWRRARGEYEVCGFRTHEVLAWRYPPAPHRGWWHAYARGGGELRAYAVVDRIDNHAHIKDIFGHRAEVLQLLDLLPPALYRSGAHSISFRYLGASWLSDGLSARGFQPRQSERMIAVGIGDALPAAMHARIGDATAWHLTDFDEDT